MTIEEKRKALYEYCNGRGCYDCALAGKVCRCGRGTHFKLKKSNDAYDMSDCEIEGAYSIVFGTESNKNNPYWENICKLQDKQRKKGIETYGQGLEDNHEPIMKRIQHIQEELVDALMYLEWVKDGLGGHE